MRKKVRRQMPLMITAVDHPHAEELDGISRIIDRNPIIYEMALQDLTVNLSNPRDWSGRDDGGASCAGGVAQANGGAQLRRPCFSYC